MRFLSAVTALAVTGVSAAARRDTDPIVKGPFIAATAPRENIFAAISAEEGNAIRAFLDSQSNVTMFV
jgi:hypothetical protein